MPEKVDNFHESISLAFGKNYNDGLDGSILKLIMCCLCLVQKMH